MIESETVRVITAPEPPVSWARVQDPDRPPLWVGVVQHAWSPDADALAIAEKDLWQESWVGR